MSPSVPVPGHLAPRSCHSDGLLFRSAQAAPVPPGQGRETWLHPPPSPAHPLAQALKADMQARFLSPRLNIQESLEMLGYGGSGLVLWQFQQAIASSLSTSRQVNICKVTGVGDPKDILGGTLQSGDLGSTSISNKSRTL